MPELLYRDNNLAWAILGVLCLMVAAFTLYSVRALSAARRIARERRHGIGGNGVEEHEKALHESMSSLPDAIIVLRDNFAVEWCNATACEWFNLNLNRHRNIPLSRLLDNRELISYLIRGKYGDSFDCPAPAAADTVIRIRIVPYRDGLFLLQARDVTQIKQLEQIRRDFVSNASHELRTPISVLYGYLEMMKEEGGETIDKRWRPAITRMYEQTERIKKIVDDMMLLSRLEETAPAEEPRYLDVATILESACGIAKMLGGKKHHRFESHIEPNFSLYGNRKEIESLVANLLSNAVRYTPEKETITVSWQVDLTGGTLSVKDTGIGIEADEIPRLTERFYRTDPARSRETGGTGLGLAIVNHIVNRHQANLIITSRPGKGSNFSVHFPSKRIGNNNEQVNLLLN